MTDLKPPGEGTRPTFALTDRLTEHVGRVPSPGCHECELQSRKRVTCQPMNNCVTVAKESARKSKAFVSRGRFADKPTADRPMPMSAKSTLTRPISVWLVE